MRYQGPTSSGAGPWYFRAFAFFAPVAPVLPPTVSPGTTASPFVRGYRNGKLLPAFASRTLDIIEIPALAARVKAEGPVRFLVAPLWPVDAYGVLGAGKKAGKTWPDLDVAVSVVLGLKWFGRYDVERQGAVVVFAGKVAAAIAEDLEEFPNTVRGTIDPLYLAASGAKGSDLYAIGEALSGIQKTFQDADCALVSRHTGTKRAAVLALTGLADTLTGSTGNNTLNGGGGATL